MTGASDLDVGWAGIGQYTTRINPCQMLTIAGAVANGGSSVPPYLVGKITSQTGKTIYEAKPGAATQLILGYRIKDERYASLKCQELLQRR